MATAGQKPVFAEEREILQQITSPSFDPRSVVCLPPMARPLVSVSNQCPARVTIHSAKSGRWILEVVAGQSALVTVAQTHYHWWRCSVNGRPTPLFRANYAFQAFEVPPGRSVVELTYEDKSFTGGAIISGLALACCVVTWRKVSQKPNSGDSIPDTSQPARTWAKNALPSDLSKTSPKWANSIYPGQFWLDSPSESRAGIATAKALLRSVKGNP
jgi:hypothetical protein